MADVQLDTVDLVVVVLYFVLVIGIGIFASCRAARGSVSGYFLAGRRMNFAMVGASLFVSNIGSEHFTGLAGSGAAGGIGVAAWEFNAIVLLQLLGFVFVPVYLACGCFTMPQYLNRRFGGQRIRVYFAILSLILYVFTKISVGLYTGALFIQQSTGWDLYLSIFGLILIVGILTITGGLTAVIYTDTLQAVLMVGGACVLTVMGFNKVGGFEGLWRKYPYAMANETVPNTTCHHTDKNWYVLLKDADDPGMPWPGFILGQTPSSIWYWCTDQVIVQRALAAKDLSHAQGATLLAGFIKVLPMFIMVMPGMISRVLYPNEVACVVPERCYEICQSYSGCSSIAYPKLVLGVLGTGLRGLLTAVIIAALMSDLDSIFNSASSLFTIDIWRRMRTRPSVREQMIVGRVFILVMVGVSIAWVPVVQSTQGGQVFLYIQEVSNYLSPPVAAVYLCALLWPRCNEQGCFWGLMVGFVMGVTRLVLIFVYPAPDRCGAPDTRPAFLSRLHYMYYAMILFWAAAITTVLVTLLTQPPTYRRLYRLLYWTRHDNYTKAEVENGDVQAVWHGNFTYHVTRTSTVQKCDDPDLDLADENIVDMTTNNQSGGAPEKGVFSLDDSNNTLPKETSRNSVIISGENDEPPGDQKRNWNQLCLDWICGISMHGNEAGQHESEAETADEGVMQQRPLIKNILYLLLIVILLFGGFMNIFWSLWKYNPEGDVWSRMGGNNISIHQDL